MSLRAPVATQLNQNEANEAVEPGTLSLLMLQSFGLLLSARTVLCRTILLNWRCVH